MRKLLLFMLLLFGLLFTSCSTTVKDKESFLKFTINATNGVEVSGFKDYMNDTPIDKKNFISIEIPDAVIIGGRTYKVVSIGEWAFNGCISLTSIEIPNSVTYIGLGAFSGCTSLTSIVIPNSVTTIRDRAFYKCTSLTSIVIPNSVTKIEDWAFYDCESLTSIEIPNSVTTIGWIAFSGCTSLTSIEIPNSVTSIGNYTFEDCSSLKTARVPKGCKLGTDAFPSTCKIEYY